MEIAPKKVDRAGPGLISILWNDDTLRNYSAIDLRDACPCATCIDEWTREKIIKREQIRKDLSIKDIRVVGRYALQMVFSDNHNTGIYPYRLLYDFKGTQS